MVAYFYFLGRESKIMVVWFLNGMSPIDFLHICTYVCLNNFGVECMFVHVSMVACKHYKDVSARKIINLFMNRIRKKRNPHFILYYFDVSADR